MSSRTVPNLVELRSRAASVVAKRWNAAWGLDVGIDDDDWSCAQVLLEVELPHVDPGAVLQVRLHRDGTWWSLPWAQRREIVPWPCAVHAWGDEAAGRIETRIRWSMPSPLEEAERAAFWARRLEHWDGKRERRALDAALAIAGDLETGALFAGMQAACAAMAAGNDNAGATALAAHALSARLALESLAQTSLEPSLIDALARADEGLAPYASGLLVLDDPTYDAIAADREMDEEAWWGHRHRLEHQVPRKALAVQLGQGGSASGEGRAVGLGGFHRQPARAPAAQAEDHPGWLAAAADTDVISTLGALCGGEEAARRRTFERAMRQLAGIPAAWIRTDIRRTIDAGRTLAVGADLPWRWAALAEAVSPAPGRVVLPLYLPEQHDGVVLELRVERSDEGLWTRAPALRAIARDAIRSAHAAVAFLSPTGQPRFRLEEHAVEIVGPASLLERIRSIDGRSLALPAALAFASLWLELPIDSDVAATGTLTGDGTTLGATGPAGTAAKARALAAWGSGQRVRFIVPAANGNDPGEEVEVVAVRTLREALASAGLAVDGAQSWNALGDAAEQIASLEASIRDLKTHNLARHQIVGMDPWLVLADRMRLSIQSLQRTGAPVSAGFVDTARAYAALAFTHAGDERASRIFPSTLEIEDGTAPPVAVFKLFSQLVAMIGTGEFERCRPLLDSLDAALDRLRPDERAWMAGLVRGTQGRAWMHAGELPLGERLPKAISLLREAVSHHGANCAVELGRSRVYLAMALRMAGEFEAAREQLERASGDLELHTKAWSGTYYRATRMYLAYERARLLVAQARSRDALQAALRDTEAALAEADERGGFWPKLGILRTRAWAFRLLGSTDDADRCAALARGLASTAPTGARAMAERIAREAAGSPVGDGEPY